MPVSISVCEFYNYPVDMSVYNTRALFCVSREMNISFGHIAKQLVTDSFARAVNRLDRNYELQWCHRTVLAIRVSKALGHSFTFHSRVKFYTIYFLGLGRGLSS